MPHLFLRLLPALVFGYLAISSFALAAPPNVILMMADDLGYGDLACYGSDKLKTPHLDKMAAEGMRLTDYYSGNTVCTPSRMALLTGAYPPRLGWQGGVGGYKIRGENGLNPEALTIAEVFKAEGYATALIGKWHLGWTDELQPFNQGFDESYYIKMSNNQTNELYRGLRLIEKPFNNRLLSEQFANEAEAFIERQKDKPFFLYLPWTAPHFPAESHPDWQDHSQLEAYGDVVEELDARVGEILAKLKELDLDDNTLVIFTSDNGTEKGQRKWGNHKPFRGLKWTTLEGGNRVPCIVRWPGVVPPGTTSDKITAAIDLLPTLAAASKIDLAKHTTGSPKIDGVNCWPTLTGNPANHPRQHLLLFHGWGTLQAIRHGNYKLYVDDVKEIAGTKTAPVLIDLASDPTESHNLAAKHPEKVTELLSLAKQNLADVTRHTIPLGGPPTKTQPIDYRGTWLK